MAHAERYTKRHVKWLQQKYHERKYIQQKSRGRGGGGRICRHLRDEGAANQHLPAHLPLKCRQKRYTIASFSKIVPASASRAFKHPPTGPDSQKILITAQYHKSIAYHEHARRTYTAPQLPYSKSDGIGRTTFPSITRPRQRRSAPQPAHP